MVVQILCLWQELYQHRKKKHKTVECTIYSGLCLIQMLLCTLHSADVRVELIKDADIVWAWWFSSQSQIVCHLCVCILESKTHTRNKHIKKHAFKTSTVESITIVYLTVNSLRKKERVIMVATNDVPFMSSEFHWDKRDWKMVLCI